MNSVRTSIPPPRPPPPNLLHKPQSLDLDSLADPNYSESLTHLQYVEKANREPSPELSSNEVVSESSSQQNGLVSAEKQEPALFHEKPIPLPRQQKPVVAQRSFPLSETTDSRVKPVAPPRQKCEKQNTDTQQRILTDQVDNPLGPIPSFESNTPFQIASTKNDSGNLESEPSSINSSKPTEIIKYEGPSVKTPPELDQTETARKRSGPKPLDLLRLVPERTSLRRLSRSILTPPLPRPLIPAPPPPPKTKTFIETPNDGEGSKMSVGNLFVEEDSRRNGFSLPDHPPPSSQSMFLDLNKLPLRFVDDDRVEHRERRRRQLQQPMASSLLGDHFDHFDFDDDDDDFLDIIRLSVLQTNGFDTGSSRDEYTENNEEPNDGERCCFSGWVKLFVSSKKQKKCWLTLRGEELSFYEDDTQDAPFIGPVSMENIRFLGLIRDFIHVLVKDRVATEKNPLEYKFAPADNQGFWLQMLTKASCQSQKVLRSNIQSSNASGHLWLKQALVDQWSEGWAFVTDRRFRYWIPSLEALFELDLRKTMQIKRDLNREYWCQKVQKSEHGPILITLDGGCLYIQAESDVCTSLWYEFLTHLFQSASRIDEYCLTTDGIPILVDKCIKFIQTYGMDLKGIYRKNGSASEARSLMADFTNDQFNFHIMRVNDETSNVAADVLRAFFRQLSEPLFPTEFHRTFYNIADISCSDSRIEAYRCTLAQFPTVNFNTIKRLVSHLAEVAEHSSKNMASIDNLSKIFGPTVFGIDKAKMTDSTAFESIKDIPNQIRVVKDLLTHFKDVFPLTARELVAKEKIEEIQNKKIIPKARANGFLVPIHLLEKDNKPFNVQSHWHASQVIEFKRDQLKEQGQDSEDYALFEVHAQGRLERRVAPDEVLSHIVLDRWLEWRSAFTDPYLILKKDTNKIDAMKTNAFADDVKYAEPGSKSFKSVHFKLESGTRVVCYSKAMKPLAKWNLTQTLWFVGNTDERKAPNAHTLTFFVVQGPDKQKIKNKLSGACISFHDNDQRTQWLNCIILCKSQA